MKKIEETESWATYRKQPRIALAIGITGVMALAAAFYLELSVVVRLALSVMTLASIIVGLTSETLRLDFDNHCLSYGERFAGFRTRSIEGDFQQLQGITVHGVSDPRRERTTVPVHTGWKVVLEYAGPPQQALDLGTFVDRDEAIRESRHLARRMNIPTKIIRDLT